MHTTDTIRVSRVLAEPTRKDKAERMAHNLGRVRKHKRKWKEPIDASCILPMHFGTYNPSQGLHYAEMSLGIPAENGMDYYTLVRSGKNKHDALIAVIREIENSTWFHTFRAEGVRFYVTGDEMETLYRGYL